MGRIFVFLALVLLPTTGNCTNIFFEDFATFDQTVWGDAFNVPVNLGRPQIVGPVTDSNVTPTRNGLLMDSSMNDRQVRAIGLLQSISGNSPLEIEVGFVPRAGGIDAALQLWLTTPTPGKNLVINVFGADFGVRRIVSSDYNVAMNQIMGLTPNYRESAGGIWNYNTYYRYLFQVGETSTHFELQTDAYATLWSVDYPIGIANYFGSDLRLNLGQYMFVPHRVAEALVIVDNVRVVQVPEPAMFISALLGIGMVLASCGRSKTRIQF